MEELNKTQIVLLTLFVTFVTSVTTGIVTVTLLQQAPTGVTQTINRVVEHTIERVTPVTTRTETRLVGQEDQIISTAALAKPAVVRIILNGGPLSEATSSEQLAAGVVAGDSSEVGTGFIITTDGLVATSHLVIPDPALGYSIFVGDKKYPAEIVFYNKNDGLALLKIIREKSVKFYAPQFISRPLALGQTVVVLGRDLERYTISVGLIASLKEPTLSSATSFKTTVRSDATNIGGPLLSGDGLVIGVNLEGGNSIPVEILRSRMASTTSR